MTGARYSRSLLFPGIGAEGQQRISAVRLAIVGIGAIGTVSAEIAVRAGFRSVTLIDRDLVEESNLQRQFLFDEEDARAARPKAEAAAEKLARMNSEVSLAARVADLNFENAAGLLAGHDILIDSCDNFETRLLVSDYGKKEGIPVLYAACVGADGVVAASLPAPDWPCLRCYLGELPPSGSGPTCETAGVVPSLPPLVASIAMGEALRTACGRLPSRGVLSFSIWEGNLRPARSFASARPSTECVVCAGRRYPALEGEGASDTVRLCGRASVQIRAAGGGRPDLDALAQSLSRVARVQRSPNVVSAPLEGVVLTLFSDGRCVVRGTEDFAKARSLYARYVGR